MQLVTKLSLRFDDDKVLEWVDRRQAKAMNRVGAEIRKIARRSIRKALKTRTKTGKLKKRKAGRTKSGSVAGGPPRFRRRGQCSLKDGIFYSYSTQDRQLVVGPILCQNKRQGGKTVPEALEFGSSENEEFPFMNPAWLITVQNGEVAKALEAF